MSRGVDLSDPRLRRLLLRVGLPSMLGLTINALYQAVDMAFVGMLGVGPVSAISAAAPLALGMAALGEGVGVGAGAAISRALGSGHDARVAKLISTAGAMVLALAVGLPLLLLVLGGELPFLFAGSSEAVGLAQDYAAVIVVGGGLILFQILFDFIAIARGHTAFSMCTLMIAFGVNLALDPVLIFVLDLGVLGAAYATVIAAGVAVAIYLHYFLFGRAGLALPDLLRRPRTALMGSIAAIGGPAAASTMLTAFSFAVMYRIASDFGTESVAGLGIALRVLTIGMLPLAGFCLGAQTVVGHSWGGGDGARTRHAVRTCLAMAVAYSAAYSLGVVLFASQTAGLFTHAAAAQAYAVEAIAVMQPAFILAPLYIVAGMLMRAKGQAVTAGLLALAPQGYVLLPIAILFSHAWGFGGLVAGHALATTLTAVVAAVLLQQDIGRPRVVRRVSVSPID
ncbi:MATE family efflux transporter [Rhodovibrio salinarum]|uniref:Multidrug resistance protein NorM n=1 Tax=Rhodovibrio salinarum TaxID=1087 RepID=A0A934V0H8_9PROT|nr:MATE family efflux transporter [Rhodovibrio salinarum]MBK1698232.1 hypothetical protein [Rhodovibrio salinarum]